MRKTITAALAGIFFFAFVVAPLEANSGLPDAVPDDFPFPEDADLQVQDSTSTTMIQIAVAFSFKSDPGGIYSTFRDYVVENGYEIIREDKPDYLFQSRNDSFDSIKVSISEMSSVKIVTVTFAGPNKS